MEVGNVGHASQAQSSQSQDEVKDVLKASQQLKTADQDQDAKLRGRGGKEEDKGNAVDTLA